MIDPLRFPIFSRLKMLVLVLVGMTVSSCNWLTAPMSTIGVVTEWGRDINHVYLITTIICAAVGAVVAILLVYAIWRFREKPGDTHIPKQVVGNHKLELLWTILPVILLIFIVVPTWQTLFKYSKEKVPADALKIEVIGHQWWWEFRYPGQEIVTANEVHLPENRAIYFEITSADVIHSYWVPRFGGKVDAVPGVKNFMSLTTPAAANDGGDYYQGQCVELCGLSHAQMRFKAVVHKAEEWDRWVASYNTPPVVETKKEQRGSDLMLTKGCIACHTITGTNAVGVIGPDLTNFGNRISIAADRFENTQEGLHEWLKDPPAAKPGSLMLNLQLTDDEISDLSAYLRNSTMKKF